MLTTLTATDSIMSPSAATTTRTIPREPPGVVTFRFQGEMAYVALADSHEEAQAAAVRALAGLAGVDPRWLVFTITIRYRRSNERQEIAIAPAAWGYVTSRLVPYRLIDVHVVPPTPPPLPPPPSPLAPPYASDSKSLAPPYPDTPPPRYPGSPQKHNGTHNHNHNPKHIPLPPHEQGYGYGYGFGWHDQTNARPPPPQLDPSEMADQRSMGWSASSVKFARADTGGSFLERIKQNAFGIFPITWEDQPEQRRRRRGKGKTRRRREREREKEKMHDLQDLQRQASGSGRSYVPSLV